nr:imidazolonepropionase [uncultured Flavobacterium sp.]
MNTLLTNIKQLVQVRDQNTPILKGAQMQELPIIENAYLYIQNGKIACYGAMQQLPEHYVAELIIDCTNRVVLPTWVDSHTHLVYAGNRVQEFVDRINGLTYEQIFERGGGILNSAQLLQETSEEELFFEAEKRLKEVIALGTGAIEIKSGYGLTTQAEIKMLRVIKKLKNAYPNLPIKATFLGAHAYPAAYKNNQQDYIDLICNEMIPTIANQKLADYVDAFLETGYFSVADTEKIMQTAKQYNIKSKIHVNQFTAINGIEMCVKNNAVSVDHLEIVTDHDIQVLQNSNTMPVALPTCSYFISIPYTPARKMLQAGLPLAIASDYNPGTTPSGNMNFVVATACIKMKMTPEEAINAATINAAHAMEVDQHVGSITKGKLGNIIITKPIQNYYEIPYRFGDNLIDKVLINGKEI